MSPARKKAADPDRAKRPMNGFMLFAKKYRLELIQQHPGKDNRAISVLLGEAWKALPMEDREQYSQKAKVRNSHTESRVSEPEPGYLVGAGAVTLDRLRLHLDYLFINNWFKKFIICLIIHEN